MRRPYLALAGHVRPIDRRGQRILGCGATVVGVVSVEKGGPAWRDGLLEGDWITGIDGQSISSVDDTRRLLVGRQGGTGYRLGVVRSGRPVALTVTAGEA